MTEIDEDGVEIAGDGYDWGRDARELVPELRAEIERLRARITPDFIAEVIRRVGGNNDMGAGALGDAIAAELIDKEAGDD